MNEYTTVLGKYAVFRGRARRKEYWMFVLFNLLISVVIALVVSVLRVGIISILYDLFIFIPSLAVTVRRLHDVNKSGWWVLIVLVPIIGAIVLIVFLAIEGDHGDNRYGPDPKHLAVHAHEMPPTH